RRLRDQLIFSQNCELESARRIARVDRARSRAIPHASSLEQQARTCEVLACGAHLGLFEQALGVHELVDVVAHALLLIREQARPAADPSLRLLRRSCRKTRTSCRSI